MSKRQFDNENNSNNLLNYFQKTPHDHLMPQTDHMPKRKTPNDFYGNCLNNQYSQIEHADNSEDENEQVSLIEVSDETEEATHNEKNICKNKECMSEVRHSISVIFSVTHTIVTFFRHFSEKIAEE